MKCVTLSYKPLNSPFDHLRLTMIMKQDMPGSAGKPVMLAAWWTGLATALLVAHYEKLIAFHMGPFLAGVQPGPQPSILHGHHRCAGLRHLWRGNRGAAWHPRSLALTVGLPASGQAAGKGTINPLLKRFSVEGRRKTRIPVSQNEHGPLQLLT